MSDYLDYAGLQRYDSSIKSYFNSNYVAKESGKGLSSNDFTNALKTKLDGLSQVTESTVSGWGFTKNTGTVTSVKVGTTSYTPSSGIISLPAYPTSLPANGGNAATVGGFQPSSFFGKSTIVTGGVEFGSQQINNANPSGLTGAYTWGTYLSFAQTNARFEVYASHNGSDYDHIYVRTGWDEDRKAWKKLAFTDDIPTTLPASDVYPWAKASTKPSYTASEVGALSTSDAGTQVTYSYSNGTLVITTK